MVKNNKDLLDKKYSDEPITHEEAIEIMLNANLTDSQANIVWAGLRKKFGNRETEPYLSVVL